VSRVLIDRHHADLFWAMQRLFEDRLGLDVWTPLGREWWDSGIWKFGEALGDDRLAQQYLVPDAKYEKIRDGTWVTYDPAHTDTAIRCCSLERARDIGDWSFVVATVQENQPGFARFAEEQGAKFVVQVGNTGQRIAWELDPLVISSSEAPLPGRGVVAHQEIDSGPGGDLGFADPGIACPLVVRSFVNAMNRLPGWDAFLEAERRLPEFEFTVHGHEGRDGNIHPISAIGKAMATAGWGWHDKPVGDGYGHIIHAWAAVGRPLIGHSRYYRGHEGEGRFDKLAAPFWEHGVTCIDLDEVDLDGAIQMVREISADTTRHARMCQEIRARFDACVDYDRDEDRVRSLLGLSRG